jgi:hypothetical protein
MIQFDWATPFNGYFMREFEDAETYEIWNRIKDRIPKSYAILDRDLFNSFRDLLHLPQQPHKVDFSTKYDHIFSFQPVALGYYASIDEKVWDTVIQRIPVHYRIPDQKLLETWISESDSLNRRVG